MIYKPLTLVVVSATLAACAPEDDGDTIGYVERLEPALDALVPPDAVFEVLADGHEWTEGPVWVPALHAVLYSDIPNNAIYRWSEGTEAAVWLTPSGYTGGAARGGETGSNGLALDPEGRLVLAQHGDRRIARLEAPLDAPAPVFATLTDRFGGKRYNSPNDLAIRSNGDVYFTDPPYGLEHGVDDPAKELDVHGVYRVATDGSVTLLVDDLSRPNGIAFSPNEEVLYVANSDPDQPVIMAYDLAEEGTLLNGRVLFGSWGDGMAVDLEGNLYVTSGRNGVLVIAPDGTHLGSLVTGERTSNCTFGDDGSTLYVTSDRYLVRMRLNAKGVATRYERLPRTVSPRRVPGGSAAGACATGVLPIHLCKLAQGDEMAAPDVASWLGGRRLLKASIHTELELAAAVREGLPLRVVDELVARGALSADEVERLVIPRRTLAHRRQKRQRLSREESDRLSRIARVVAHAEDVLGDVEAARGWLRRPNRALEGRWPLETLDTDGGARAVEAVLDRAAYGVYS